MGEVESDQQSERGWSFLLFIFFGIAVSVGSFMDARSLKNPDSSIVEVFLVPWSVGVLMFAVMLWLPRKPRKPVRHLTPAVILGLALPGYTLFKFVKLTSDTWTVALYSWAGGGCLAIAIASLLTQAEWGEGLGRGRAGRGP